MVIPKHMSDLDMAGNSIINAANLLSWKKVWVNNLVYAINDAVSYNGISYYCIAQNINHSPPNATYWEVFASQGSIGPIGLTGANGATWYSGSGIPSSGTGLNNDYYINTSNSDVYKKNSNVWTVVLNIKGATGAVGATGPSGGAAGSSVFNLVATGNCVVLTPNSITKSGGSDGWDSQVYSVEGYSRGCAINFKMSQNNMYVAIGLNSDPLTDASYASLDFGWYILGTGVSAIMENGGSVGNYGTYTSSTLFTITYDGHNIRYFKDGVLQRTTARAIGATLYLDSSFYNVGMVLNTLSFMPMGESAI